jgi:hypothetical protein
MSKSSSKWDTEKPNPDKPERIATKTPRHKGKMFTISKLRVLVSWWSAAGGLNKSIASML